MSAPLFLVDELPARSRYALIGPEGHHAADVQRLRVGERLVLADGRGGTADASVVAVSKGRVDVEIGNRHVVAAPDPRIVVVQGIAKGDRGELAVQAMTEAGVDEIVPWAAARSVAQWRGDRGAKSRDKWVATAREAAKQARRPWLPLIGGDPDVSTRQVAARLIAGAVATPARLSGAALVLHEEAATRLTQVALPGAGEIVLIVGPEGGISDAEIDTFTAAGAQVVKLGDAVLRTSTAGVAALAVLSTRLGRW